MMQQIVEFVRDNPGLTREELTDAISDMYDEDPDNVAWWIDHLTSEDVFTLRIDGDRLVVECADE